MATPDINDAFVDQFESEIKVAYQQMSSLLRDKVRVKSVTGDSTTFQNLGKGTAASKSRHGNVPVLNLQHTPVTASMADYYAGEYIDKLDELKIQHDERGSVSRSIAAALGRAVDAAIIAQLATTSNTTVHGTAGMTFDKVEAAYVTLGNNDVPNDGMRYMAVAPRSWADLMDLDEFAREDYVGEPRLSGSFGMMKRWFSFNIFEHTSLGVASTIRDNPYWHKDAVGLGENSGPNVQVDWVAEKAAWFVSGSVSVGAALIDTTGVGEIQTDEP